MAQQVEYGGARDATSGVHYAGSVSDEVAKAAATSEDGTVKAKVVDDEWVLAEDAELAAGEVRTIRVDVDKPTDWNS
jgi:hypothetical protein